MRRTRLISCCFIILSIFAVMAPVYAQHSAEPATGIPMPGKMADSLFVIRPGISDFNGASTGGLFQGKTFKKTENLDGSISTARYGKATIVGNEYILPIEVITNGKMTVILTFFLEFSGDYTYLRKVRVENFQTGQKEESEAFSDKFGALIVFMQLLE